MGRNPEIEEMLASQRENFCNSMRKNPGSCGLYGEIITALNFGSLEGIDPEYDISTMRMLYGIHQESCPNPSKHAMV